MDKDSDNISEDGSDFSSLSCISKISMNIQQLNSRYHSSHSTIKEILKKCSQAYAAHKTYEENYNGFLKMLSEDEERLQKILDNTHENFIEKKQEIDELLSKSKDSSNNLNDCIELGEKILSTTAPEGREGIRLQKIYI